MHFSLSRCPFNKVIWKCSILSKTGFSLNAYGWNHACWHGPIIPAFGKQRRGDGEIKEAIPYMNDRRGKGSGQVSNDMVISGKSWWIFGCILWRNHELNYNLLQTLFPVLWLWACQVRNTWLHGIHIFLMINGGSSTGISCSQVYPACMMDRVC